MYSVPVGWQRTPQHPWPPPCFVAWIAVPVRCEPVAPCPPRQCHEVVLPREIAVDAANPSRSDIIGGRADSTLTIEYVVNPGAAAPSVEVELVAAGSTATWTATELGEGYHAHEAVLQAVAGTMVTLTVAEGIARLRWCERICC